MLPANSFFFLICCDHFWFDIRIFATQICERTPHTNPIHTFDVEHINFSRNLVLAAQLLFALFASCLGLSKTFNLNDSCHSVYIVYSVVFFRFVSFRSCANAVFDCFHRTVSHLYIIWSIFTITKQQIPCSMEFRVCPCCCCCLCCSLFIYMSVQIITVHFLLGQKILYQTPNNEYIITCIHELYTIYLLRDIYIFVRLRNCFYYELSRLSYHIRIIVLAHSRLHSDLILLSRSTLTDLSETSSSR